jgi:hypothetical protein
MAISFDLEAVSAAPAAHAFGVVSDLRCWDAFNGVVLVGPARALRVGDRVDVSLRVMRRDIRSGCRVCTVVEPRLDAAGTVEIRAIDGPFEAVVVGTVTPTGGGCAMRLEVSGVGRGAARMLEGPVDYVLRHWAAHQLRHLLVLVEAEPSAVTV